MRKLVFVVAFAMLMIGGGTPSGAAEGCRSWCESELAKCKMACADSAVVDDCRANCQLVFQACLDNC